MLKYKDYYVVFEEIPDEITLAINISNCQNRCVGCHSPELRGNIGDELNAQVLDKMLRDNDGITCVCFMGEGNDRDMLRALIEYVNRTRNSNGVKIKVAIYSGREEVEDWYYENCHYVKVGPYKPDCGPLNVKTTNQRLYKCYVDDEKFVKEDITYKFWNK